MASCSMQIIHNALPGLGGQWFLLLLTKFLSREWGGQAIPFVSMDANSPAMEQASTSACIESYGGKHRRGEASCLGSINLYLWSRKIAAVVVGFRGGRR